MDFPGKIGMIFFFFPGNQQRKEDLSFMKGAGFAGLGFIVCSWEISLTLPFLFIFTFFPEKGETRKARSSQRFRCEMLFFALDDVTFHRVSGTGLPL